MPAIAPPRALSHRQVQIVLSGLMLGVFLSALDQTIVATALPTIVGDLGGLNHLSWVVTAYLLTATVSTPLYGKISDLYGRKNIYQAAIVIFLVGSVLSGLARNMDQLIAFRALQGLGGGGLMALALAIIGDIVKSRERGRYQGYYAAVFALASVGGPLAGGFLVEHLSWRWVFYVNIPVGLVALVVTASVLRLPFARRPHSIDFLGAALMVTAVSALLLLTVWGGNTYPWHSPVILALGVGSLVALGLFVLWERRTSEPLLPLRLFSNRVFVIATPLSFCMAACMFAATIYLPVYLQLVHGISPASSGLLLLPLLGGLVFATILAGRIVMRIGRYKAIPIVGFALVTLGMWLLSTLRADTPYYVTGAYMFLTGVGMGPVTQVNVVAVQNAVDPRELGTATSAVSFFRNMGAALGTALFGAILASRLAYWLPRLVPASAHINTSASFTTTPALLAHLPPRTRTAIASAFVDSLHSVFLVGVGVAAFGLLLSLFLQDKPLREHVHVGSAVPAET